MYSLKKVLLALIFVASCTNGVFAQFSIGQTRQVFKKIPDSVQLAVYWYWISDNISREGVIKDLEAMKRVGINRAFIGSNIVDERTPIGPHKIFSEEWWAILHTALKKATELNIEIGLFNSPGWSQSGGPWNSAEQSMRYLATSDTLVTGPSRFSAALPFISDLAQDVKILAYPVKENIEKKTWKISKNTLPGKVLDMTVGDSQEARTLLINVDKTVKTSAKLYYMKGLEYHLLKEIEIDRSNPELHVGFNPFAPVVISLPETKTGQFRLELKDLPVEMSVTLTTEATIERYPEKTLAKMFQTPLPLWNTYIWERQPMITRASGVSALEVKDVTNYFVDGKLNWDVPTGKWKILRFAMKPTGVKNGPASPEGTGPEVDKMSKKHVAHHFDSFLGEILRRVPENDRKSFKVIVQDSYEMGGQNWTDDMAQRFKETYGYDPIPYLPALAGTIVGNADISDRFLWDLRRLIADRVAYDYVGGFRDIGHQHGLTTWLENYGHWGFPAEFLQYGGQSDEIGGEFWNEGELGDVENRAASSCGHIYGKGKIWAESFTASGKTFERSPSMMKSRADRFFTEGINATLLHVYIHQPYEDRWPGINAWFGSEFNRKNTWFDQMGVFSEYLKRCNVMLQQGRYIADVAYFIGEDVPKMTGVCDPELPKGYSFDYINAEVLLKYASVKNGRLVLKSGMEYSVLVLPRQKSMRPELLKKIMDLVQQGLVVLGPKPEYSPSLKGFPLADQQVKDMGGKLWKGFSPNSSGRFGSGRIFGEDVMLTKVFNELQIFPDFSFDGDSLDLRFIHRKVKDGDIYFISNQGGAKASFNATFRVGQGTPQLWNPLTAEARDLPEFVQDKHKTLIPLELEAGGSMFIVFDTTGKRQGPGINFPAPREILVDKKPWRVKFSGLEAPSSSIVLKDLIDFTQSENDSIKYFSGTAIYTTDFEFSSIPDKSVYLDLGRLTAMAKVFVNDKAAGGVWTYPYRLNVSSLLKKGTNSLRVEVVNNWMNRLIGDSRLPDKERKTWTVVNPYRADSALQPSGLFGPVKLQVYDYTRFTHSIN